MMFNQAVKDKMSELALAFLLGLQGAVKSWTIWVNASILALPYAFDNIAALQPYLPADLYVKIAFYLPLVNFFLRMRTTQSLASKASSPLDVVDRLRNVVPMLALGLLGLAMMLPTPARAGTIDYTVLPVKRDKDGGIYRSSAAAASFRAATVCPVTGLKSKACAGYIVDHIWPLKCARNEWERRLFDAPANMQYQTVAESRRKDLSEGAVCKAAAKVAGI